MEKFQSRADIFPDSNLFGIQLDSDNDYLVREDGDPDDVPKCDLDWQAMPKEVQ